MKVDGKSREDLISRVPKQITLESFTARAFASHAGVLTALLVLLLAGCSTPMIREEPQLARTINFDSDEVGKMPPDFTAALTGDGAQVSWVVREEKSQSGGEHVLAQESKDVTNYRFPLCVYDKVNARDVAAEVKFKAIFGTLDRSGGIILRYTPGNYYIARANALENNVILFKTVNGKRSKIEEVPVTVTGGEWHTLRFEAKGSHLKIIFDGKTVLERNNHTFTGPGKVGLWTKADSVSAFKDFKIEPVAP